MNHFRMMVLSLALLLPGACASVRQAPVEERQDMDTTGQPVVEPDVAPPLEEPVSDFPAGEPPVEEGQEEWVKLPDPDGTGSGEAPAQGQATSDNPAVLALLDDTDIHVSEGNTEGAAEAIERALRLEPKNPWLWHRLAALKLEQGQWRQAEALAQKSNSLSAGHPAVRKANAELIAQAKKHQ